MREFQILGIIIIILSLHWEVDITFTLLKNHTGKQQIVHET